jgi:hydroxymethylpyrimidine/phosphomethylpyrimidine kinase
MIVAQVRAVAEDIGVDAVKIGMLGTVATIQAVAQALDGLAGDPPVVLDPVMVSETGARLLREEARLALVHELLPRATVVTPNLPEARVLAGLRADAPGRPEEPADADEHAHAHERDGEAVELARAIHAFGPRCVVVTGGHRAQATDVFFDGLQVTEIPGAREPDGAAHGSGCTHSSVLAARLARGDAPLAAAREARRRAASAVRDGLRDVGAGPGPVDVLGIAARSVPTDTVT